MKTRFTLTCFTLLFLASISDAALFLVSSSVRNGSFEDTTIAPWTGITRGDTNPSIPAFDGVHYGTLFASGPVGEGAISDTAFLSLPIVLTSGDAIYLTFQAILPDPVYALDVLTVTLLDASSITYSPQSYSSTLSTSWSLQSYSFSLPATFDDTGDASLMISFGRTTSVAGRKYGGYVDAINMTQTIPEPSSCILILSGFAVLYGASRARKTK
jgi:hypothetical protein